MTLERRKVDGRGNKANFTNSQISRFFFKHTGDKEGHYILITMLNLSVIYNNTTKQQSKDESLRQNNSINMTLLSVINR